MATPKHFVRGDVVLVEATVEDAQETAAGDVWVRFDESSRHATYVPAATIHSITKPVFKSGDPIRHARNGMAGEILAVCEISRLAWCRFGGKFSRPESILFDDITRAAKPEEADAA